MKQATSFVNALRRLPIVQRAADIARRHPRLVKGTLAVLVLAQIVYMFVLILWYYSTPSDLWDRRMALTPLAQVVLIGSFYGLFKDRLQRLRAERLPHDTEPFRRRLFDTLLIGMITISFIVQWLLLATAPFQEDFIYNWGWVFYTCYLGAAAALIFYAANHYFLAPCAITGSVFVILFGGGLNSGNNVYSMTRLKKLGFEPRRR